MDDVDSMVAKLFRLRAEREPDSDPGDLTIRIQDDMPLVEVTQRGQTLGRGRDVLAAMLDAVGNVSRGQALGILGTERLLTVREAAERDHAQREALRRVLAAE